MPGPEQPTAGLGGALPPGALHQPHLHAPPADGQRQLTLPGRRGARGAAGAQTGAGGGKAGPGGGEPPAWPHHSSGPCHKYHTYLVLAGWYQHNPSSKYKTKVWSCSKIKLNLLLARQANCAVTRLVQDLAILLYSNNRTFNQKIYFLQD